MSGLDGRPPLPLDAVSSLRIYGLSRSNDGLSVSIDVQRVPHGDIKSYVRQQDRPVPPAVPSLPPPGPACSPIVLEIELVHALPAAEESRDSEYDDGYDDDEDEDDHGDEEESENTGSSESDDSDDDSVSEVNIYRKKASIYSVRVLQPDTYPYYIPPLAIKVGAERRGKRVYRESGAYKHLEPVQGLVVPRCYGYFRTTVDQRVTTIQSWDPKCKFPRDPARFSTFRPPHPSASLDVLLLEEVGGRIPLYTIPRKMLRKELIAMYRQLVQLDVDPVDIRYANVLLAPASPPGLVGEKFLKLGRPFNFRVIDFEFAVRTNRRSLWDDVTDCIDRIVEVVCGVEQTPVAH